MNRVLNSHCFGYLKTKRFFHCPALKMSAEKKCSDAKEIFQAAVKSVQPENLINRMVEVHSNFVQIQGKQFYLEKNCYIVGFGKAVLGMAQALESKLKGHVVSGIISVPDGILNSSASNRCCDYNSFVQVYQGAFNNVPDEKSLLAASKISKLVASLQETDLLFVLISGGGSALLPSPKPPITLHEKLKVINLMASKGASIEELNTVRKRLSTLKGGGLAELARPAKIISLILSDIVGDPLGLIASGPTVENADDPQLPLTIIEKYGLKNDIPKTALQLLQNIQVKDLNKNNSFFSHVSNFIIGNNQVALESAASSSRNLNYFPIILTNVLIGKASYVGSKLISMVAAALDHETQSILQICDELKLPKKCYQILLDSILKLECENRELCLLLGGETTVEVLGTGVGGRNQELALAAAIELEAKKPGRNITLLSAGTDGIDGPTDAAGAIATSLTIKSAETENLNPIQFLNNNDSHTFYSKLSNGQYHVKTGHTGTNVMDIIIILIK